MASILFTIGSFVFSRLADHGTEERKRHDLALEKLQRARDEWNKDRMKRLNFMNKRLREKNEARTYINNVDEAMFEYYRVFAKQIKPLPPEPELSDFYHPSEIQKNGELLFVVMGTSIATYALYKYLKYDEEKLYQANYEPDRLWADVKAIKELHKLKSMSKKDIKSWLAKQALWQVHIPPPNEIYHPHYDVTKPNKQHQFDLLYMPYNLFERNTYKYILTGIDVASR